MHSRTRTWAPLLLVLFSQVPPLKALTTTTELSPARIGSVYAYAIQANHAAHFTKVDGNSAWLSVTPDGILTGTPNPDAAKTAEITVEASWQGQALRRSFVLQVLPFGCRTEAVLGWCDEEAEPRGPAGDQGESAKTAAEAVPERFAFQARELGPNLTPTDLDCPLGQYCIVQFHRLHAPRGEFGHFNPQSGFIDWNGFTGGPLQKPITDAIDGSKVLFSGSVIFRKKVTACESLSWTVVTQTVDSSNNLIYAAPDITVFCTEDHTLLIVLPVHAIWADVYSFPASTKSSAWQPLNEPPPARYCKAGHQFGSVDPSIFDCDFRPGWYSKSEGWVYNRLALPGVSQGSISVTPWAAATKATWDVQLYGATRVWGGYVGAQLMYEHDRKLADDFNSLTGALTYDVRIRNANPFWLCSKSFDLAKGKACDPPSRDTPPFLGLRPLELNFRGGVEESPSLDTNQKGIYLPEALNGVLGALLRVPFVVSPKLPGFKNPVVSQLTLTPVAGLEGGRRLISNPICAQFPTSGSTTCAASVPQPAGSAGCSSETQQLGITCQQPQSIFRRVAGVDASLRWPYQFTRLIFGDRPATIDFSYRARWLDYAEPFFNDTWAVRNSMHASSAFPEIESKGERSYTRVTLIVPASPYVQYRVTWQHGSLPPLFQYVGSEATVGISFSNPGLSEH